MGDFFLVVDAPCLVHTTKNYVDHNVWGVFLENLLLCLTYLGKTHNLIDCGTLFGKSEGVEHQYISVLLGSQLDPGGWEGGGGSQALNPAWPEPTGARHLLGQAQKGAHRSMNHRPNITSY